MSLKLAAFGSDPMVTHENPPTDEQVAAKCPAKCIGNAMGSDPMVTRGQSPLRRDTTILV